MSSSRKKKNRGTAAPRQATALPQRHWQRDVCAMTLLAALILVVYGRCITYDYLLYDDPNIIFQNPSIMAGLTLEGVWWAFTTPNFGLYQPLPSITFMLDRSLFGDWVGGYHAMTMLWHLLCSCTFFWVAKRLFNNFPIAFGAALFFAVHPVQAMVVNWIAARNEIMPTFFLLLSIEAYRRYVVKGGRNAAAASLVFMLLAMLCKQTAVLLPAALLLLDFWPLRRISFSWGRPVAALRAAVPLGLEKLPWAAVSAAGVFFAFYGKADMFDVAERNTLLAPLENMGIAAVSYGRYLFHFLYPLRYMFYYSASEMPSLVAQGFALALLLVITAVALAFMSKRPYLLVGWGWFVLLLLPVSGLVEFAREAIALRYMYLPAIGLYIIIACWLYDKLAARDEAVLPTGDNGGDGRALSPALYSYWAGVGILTLVWAALCFWQGGFWRDSEALAMRALEVSNNTNAMAHNHLAVYRMQQGRYEDVYMHQREAAMLEPDVPLFQINYAALLVQQERYEEAEAILAPHIAARAHSVAFLSHYGTVLIGLGRLDEARDFLERALAIRSDYVPAMYSLALCLIRQGDTEEGRMLLERVLRAQPNHPQAQQLLALVDGS